MKPSFQILFLSEKVSDSFSLALEALHFLKLVAYRCDVHCLKAWALVLSGLSGHGFKS